MPIEFRCTECNKLLRTPDDTAGKQAKCPECGAVMQIPQHSPGPELPPQPAPAAPREPENPYQSPADYPAPLPSNYPAAGAIVPTPLDLGDVFTRSWKIFADQWLMCGSAWLIAFVLNGVFGQLVGQGANLIGVAAGDRAVAIVSMILAQVTANLFALWISIGQWLFFLKTARGWRPSLRELFRGGPYLVTVLLAGLLVSLAVFGLAACFVLPTTAISWLAMPNARVPVRLAVSLGTGGVLAIVPCIVVGLMLSQFYFLILDRNAGITESLRLSKWITSGNKLMIFAIHMIAGFAGGAVVLLTCFIGILAVGPYLALLGAVMYLAMTGQATADQQPAPGPGPFAPAAAGSPFVQPGGVQPVDPKIPDTSPNSA